jgi:hypothetical protein
MEGVLLGMLSPYGKFRAFASGPAFLVLRSARIPSTIAGAWFAGFAGIHGKTARLQRAK